MDETTRGSGFRPFDVLGPLGLLVLVAAAGWQRLSTRPLPGEARWYYAAGAALILAHLVLRWDDVAARIGRRQMRYGANTAVLVTAVAAVLGGLNYLASRRDKTWDLSKGQRHSLSEPTRRVLGQLKEDVTLTYFERGNRMDQARPRLEQYRQASPHVKVVYVDPMVDPQPAKALEVTSVPTIVVARGERRERISNESEQDITNAIIKITRGAKKTVCFVEGEGERDIDDGSGGGFSAARTALANTQYETRKVFLAREGRVPADCTVLVVAGPAKDLAPPAVEALRHFVKQGGRALLMLEPELEGGAPSLVPLLADWNIEVGRDVIVDASGAGQAMGGGPLTLVVMDYPYHDITKDLRGVSTLFHIARSVQAGKGTATGIAAQNVAQTLDRVSWAESDLSLKGPLAFDEGKDRRGPVPLAAVVTLAGSALEPVGAAASPPPPPAVTLGGPVVAAPATPPLAPSPAPSGASPAPSIPPSPSPSASPGPADGESESKREARVAVFGDADFASNALLQVSGNQDLFVNTIAWLANDPDLISIRVPDPEDQRLFLTQQQQGNVWLLSILLLPGALLALGVASWWRRRG